MSLVVGVIGPRIVGHVIVSPPVVVDRVSISSFLAFVVSFAFSTAFVLSSLAFRGRSLYTFVIFASLFVALFLSTFWLDVSFDAAIVAR